MISRRQWELYGIIFALCRKVSFDLQILTKYILVQEWNQLKLYIEEFYPQTFALKSVVSPFEFDVMILVRLGFKPSEIAVLTDSSLPNVSNARKRMHEKLTKSKGSAKDFDKYIKTLI